jgi:hypothetical protein
MLTCTDVLIVMGQSLHPCEYCKCLNIRPPGLPRQQGQDRPDFYKSWYLRTQLEKTLGCPISYILLQSEEVVRDQLRRAFRRPPFAIGADEDMACTLSDELYKNIPAAIGGLEARGRWTAKK